jgi:hypothetical protein
MDKTFILTLAMAVMMFMSLLIQLLMFIIAIIALFV